MHTEKERNKMSYLTILASSSSLLLFMTIFFLVPQVINSFPHNHINGRPDLINKTCERCANKSTTLNTKFCQTSLETIPISHLTNLHGLGIVAMELAIKNATSTVSAIENMLAEKAIDLDTFAIARLGDCLQLYRESVTMMLDAIGAFYSQRYRVANLLMTAAMDGASTCDDGFGGGGESPLSKQYYDLFQLTDVALCIIRLASLVSSSSTAAHQ